ncbi:hypothetical protein [Parasitella parasitica]|uniref:Uncharacterized protein n=1 Tax=Parasitella parasitica TaxID=35722 RepID=A0A0B7MRB5_9FUNG|nr:hypothetical protein [Parasitella parasitica]
MAYTLNYPHSADNQLPPEGTILPQAWHLAYFPPRVPESKRSPDGCELDWSPPFSYVRRMWASGESSWNKDNSLKVDQEVTMQSPVRDIQMRQGGRRGDSVDKHLHTDQGCFATESRCWVYLTQKEDYADHPKETAITIPPPSPSHRHHHHHHHHHHHRRQHLLISLST